MSVAGDSFGLPTFKFQERIVCVRELVMLSLESRQ